MGETGSITCGWKEKESCTHEQFTKNQSVVWDTFSFLEPLYLKYCYVFMSYTQIYSANCLQYRHNWSSWNTASTNKRDAVSVSWCESDFPCCLLFACYAICFSCVPFDRKLWWVFFLVKSFLPYLWWIALVPALGQMAWITSMSWNI